MTRQLFYGKWKIVREVPIMKDQTKLWAIVLFAAVTFGIVINGFIPKTNYTNLFPSLGDGLTQQFELFQDDQSLGVFEMEFRKKNERLFEVFIAGEKSGSLEWTDAGIIDSKGYMLVPLDREQAHIHGVIIEIPLADTIRFSKEDIHSVLLKVSSGEILEYSASGVTGVAVVD